MYVHLADRLRFNSISTNQRAPKNAERILMEEPRCLTGLVFLTCDRCNQHGDRQGPSEVLTLY